MYFAVATAMSDAVQIVSFIVEWTVENRGATPEEKEAGLIAGEKFKAQDGRLSLMLVAEKDNVLLRSPAI